MYSVGLAYSISSFDVYLVYWKLLEVESSHITYRGPTHWLLATCTLSVERSCQTQFWNRQHFGAINCNLWNQVTKQEKNRSFQIKLRYIHRFKRSMKSHVLKNTRVLKYIEYSGLNLCTVFQMKCPHFYKNVCLACKLSIGKQQIAWFQNMDKRKTKIWEKTSSWNKNVFCVRGADLFKLPSAYWFLQWWAEKQFLMVCLRTQDSLKYWKLKSATLHTWCFFLVPQRSKNCETADGPINKCSVKFFELCKNLTRSCRKSRWLNFAAHVFLRCRFSVTM